MRSHRMQCEDDPKTQYAIKVEPADNGPLFSENNIYMRALKGEDLDAFRARHSE